MKHSAGLQSVCSGVLALVALLVGCTPLQDVVDWSAVDLMPPTFLGAQAVSERSIRVSFDESVEIIDQAVSLGGVAVEASASASGAEVMLELSSTLPAGSEATGMLVVADSRGNLTNLSFTVSGYNGRIPGLLINELVVKGSGTRPDWTEILVTAPGNLAGVTIMDGSPWDWENRYVFPDVEVAVGDWLVVHWKPEGIPEEVSELASISASGGRDATDTARDFWVDPPGGLVGTNGVLALLTSPGGTMLDAVIYSNRTSESDTDYRGFGSRKTMNRVDWVSEMGGWTATGDALAPEDAVWSGSTTSTRSLSRGSSSLDTHTATDWHTVPTSGASPGATNTDERHE